ncbi:MAG: hypothetical protein SVT52_03315 [Planctomycetota bacterium]|nr:hypothetical protein [Planctomycetota bacterium]
MQRSRDLIFGALVAACLVGMLTVAGCSASKSRRARQNILEEVLEAQRLVNKALALLASPVYAVGDKYAPFTTSTLVGPGEGLKILPGTALNPNAWQALQQAEDGLSAVLAENAEARPEDRAMGQSMLARVASLKGDYQATIAAAARDRAGEALREAQKALGLMEFQLSLCKYFHGLANLTDKELRQMISNAKADVQKFTTASADVRAKIDRLTKDRDALLATNEERIAAARNLRIESRLASGQKSLDLLQDALKIESQVSSNASKIGGIESQITSGKTEAKTVHLDLTSAKARLDVSGAVLKARKQQFGSADETKTKLLGTIAEAQKHLERLAERTFSACAAAAEAETAAANAYELARKQLKAAAEALHDHASAEAMAEQADVLMAMAELNVRRLELQIDSSRLAKQIQSLWAEMDPPRNVPPALARAGDYLAEPAMVRQTAEAQYEEAAKLYKKAMSKVRRELQWAYQGQLAAAYIRLYHLSNRADSLEEARAVLQEAFEGRENSPHLASVAELQRMVNDLAE